jgi:hypothetical protein
MLYVDCILPKSNHAFATLVSAASVSAPTEGLAMT